MAKRTQKRKNEDLPCRLREIRKAQGKSIVGLAHESGVARDQILYIEMKRGEGQPSTHLKLAKALGVSLDEYFGFATLEAVSGGEPEIVKSDSSVIVEQLAPLPGSDLNIKRIQITPHKECTLTRYLDPKKPVFFYLAQGEAKVGINQKEHLLKPGDHLGLSLPGKVRIENLASLPLAFLMIQP